MEEGQRRYLSPSEQSVAIAALHYADRKQGDMEVNG